MLHMILYLLVTEAAIIFMQIIGIYADKIVRLCTENIHTAYINGFWYFITLWP